ncbi:MAG: hypothetical protein IPI35_15290 [Deltaproteobacteria bacterium]|nr:hypothetical protein [Deltaproteobacteria bacterium]
MLGLPIEVVVAVLAAVAVLGMGVGVFVFVNPSRSAKDRLEELTGGAPLSWPVRRRSRRTRRAR